MLERLIHRLNAEARRTVEGIRAQTEGRAHPPVHINARGVSYVRPADVLTSEAGRRAIERTIAAGLTARHRAKAEP